MLILKTNDSKTDLWGTPEVAAKVLDQHALQTDFSLFEKLQFSQ